MSAPDSQAGTGPRSGAEAGERGGDGLQARARAIFEAALEEEEDAREVFVGKLCGEDAPLREEVESLLGSWKRARGFLDESVLDAAGAYWIGRRVGEYQLVGLIGRGGVGLVFEAIQDRPRRAVALKLLRPEFADEEVRRRFELEAELLARLEHPGIARVFAAGTVDTELGPQAFLAMERIEGRSLLTYAKEEGLPARERVELVQHVCEAMQHAHERGVIHRDLKPGNVLVDRAGCPKVLDFGVARATGADLDVETLCTRAGALLGTVSYMSPEQSRAESRLIDERTDVYSLGVILYQLLSGRLPLPVSELPLPEAIRSLGEDEPPALSVVAPDVHRDLATVVDKAIARDPARRYASAGELGADLGRWLASEPVRARPPSALYRLEKLAQRNRDLVASVLVIIGALATVALIATVGAFRQQALRVRSERAEEKALQAQRRSERDANAANMTVVENALADADVAEARARLEAAPAHLRGWEWNHFADRLDRSEVVLDNGSGIEAMALAPDGRTLVTGGTDRVVRAWDLERTELLWSVSLGESYTVRGLAVDPGGESVAAARGSWFAGRGRFGPIVLLGLADGELLGELAGHSDAVQALAYHPTAPRLFSASSDGTVRAWDLEGQREEGVIARHERDAQDLALSPDGALVASVGWDGRVSVLDAATLEPVHQLETGERLTSLGWSADGSRLAVGTWDGRVLSLDPVTGTRQDYRGRHRGRVERVAFAAGADGRAGSVLSAGAGNTLLRHLLPRGVETHSLMGSTDVVTGFAIEQGGGTLLSGGLDGLVRRWDAETQDVPRLVPHAEWVYDVSLSPDGRRLVTTGPGPRGVQPGVAHVHVLDLPSRELRLRFTVPNETILWSAELAPDGERIVTAGSLSGGILWSASTGEPLLLLEHPDHLRCATFHPSGALIATTCRDRVVRLWDAETGELEAHFSWDEHRPYTARFSPDGRVLVTSYYDGALALWDVTSGELLVGRDQAHPGSVYALAFAPDGKRLASGGADGHVIEWMVEGLAPTGRRLSSPASVIDLAYLPDGSRLFVGDGSAALRVVETEGWTTVVGLEGHTGTIRGVAVDRAGRFVVTGGSDGDVRLWSSGDAVGEGSGAAGRGQERSRSR